MNNFFKIKQIFAILMLLSAVTNIGAVVSTLPTQCAIHPERSIEVCKTELGDNTIMLITGLNLKEAESKAPTLMKFLLETGDIKAAAVPEQPVIVATFSLEGAESEAAAHMEFLLEKRGAKAVAPEQPVAVREIVLSYENSKITLLIAMISLKNAASKAPSEIGDFGGVIVTVLGLKGSELEATAFMNYLCEKGGAKAVLNEEPGDEAELIWPDDLDEIELDNLV